MTTRYEMSKLEWGNTFPNMEGEHNYPWLCCRVFSRISSRVVECHLVFQRIFPYSIYFTGGCRPQFRGSSAHFLNFAKSKGLYQRKTVFSLTNWFTISLIMTSFEPFFPKRMFPSSAVFMSVMFMWLLCYQRIKNSGPHAWTHSQIYFKCFFCRYLDVIGWLW